MVDDTHPRVQAKVNEIFAAMAPGERFAAMAGMTDFVFDQSMAAIAATMPGASPMEVALRWSEIHYGMELTERVRRCVAARRGDERRPHSRPNAARPNLDVEYLRRWAKQLDVSDLLDEALPTA